MFKKRGLPPRLGPVVATLILCCATPVPMQLEEASGQTDQASDPWGPLRLLVGAWEGAIDGKLGAGKGVRRYEFINNGRFLLCRHLSVRLPQEKSPEGDQHEELGVFSFDSQRKTLVYREFLSEGVVVRSPCKVDGMTVVCTSEAVESGPGIRARLRLEITDRYRFVEKYELAWPGQEELEHYFTNQWTRAPRPQGWE